MIKIRSKKTKKKNGFNVPVNNSRKVYYFAIELNRESFEFYDMDNGLVEDTLELHHISMVKITSRKDEALMKEWANQVATAYISPQELLAEFYARSINDHALAIGANTARIYHNAYLGDTRIHPNSIGHVFEPVDGQLPEQCVRILKKYVKVEKIVPGDKITLRNRLGS